MECRAHAGRLQRRRAAALAAGMTPFEIGTDMQNSIRLPAHFCGVFGLKPTENRVSLEGGFPNPGNAPRTIHIMSCIGPMARTAEDLALLYKIIAGPDASDTDLQPVPVEDMPAIEVKGLRVAYALTFPGFPVAAAIRAAVEGLARKLQRRRCGRRERKAAGAGFPCRPAGRRRADRHDAWSSAARARMSRRPALPAISRPCRNATARSSPGKKFLSQWDALLCPVSMTTAFPIARQERR